MEESQAVFYALTRPLLGGHTRLVSQPALELIKALRSKGYSVIVEPNDGSKIEYYIRKGEIDLLQDPLLLKLIEIPIAIFTSVVSAWLYDRWRRREGKNSTAHEPKANEESKLVVVVQKEREVFYYNHSGLRIDKARAEAIFDLQGQQAKTLSAMRIAESPYPDMPFPICLEHTNRVVGWANLREEPRGLLASPAIITDSETWERVERGELRGFSIAGAVRDSQCSICGGDYAECNHISGLDYEGQVCVNTIRDVDLVEVSIVGDPVNQRCMINLKKEP